ncbi:hypothetical protein Clacol_003278 [Clathrus columnatus]|uniref:Terpene synthase n=1 Tax=Clathrus columnatus TaxID=1419009 RepID=A0AAV5A7S1_9AGAM|nr:hypothetical protein Clacol_003278 [Clathrus columnatus]
MSEKHFFVSPHPIFHPEYHIERVSSAVKTFLDDMDFAPTNINPVNKDLENSMEKLMYARGMECEQLKRTLHLAAALIECTLEEKTNAALFTWYGYRFGVYMDDRIIKDPIPFREFGARILRNQQQLDPVLAAYTEVLNHMWDLYDPMVASIIFNNTLNFVTGSCIEPEIQKVSIVQGVDRFGWYIRDLTGVGIAFALFPYTKTGNFDILSVIQAIPDMNFWLSTANDLLSFHKEESASETGTHIYIRAITSNQSRYDTCDELVAELKKTRETIYAALAGNQAALETWKVWERGFVEWHLIQERYRLNDLGVVSTAVTGITVKKIRFGGLIDPPKGLELEISSQVQP